MRRLAGARELLDGPLDDPDALRGNLRDLARINRLMGGTAASRRALDPSPSVIRPATSTTLTSPTCRVFNFTLTNMPPG